MKFRGWVRFPATLALVAAAMAAPSSAGRPPLAVSGDKLVDPAGKTVVLRGVSSMGMGMVATETRTIQAPTFL